METDLQYRFNSTIALLERNFQIDTFTLELLDYMKTDVVHYSGGTFLDKDWALSLYTFRGNHEKEGERANNPYVLGYDFLLPRLAKTKNIKINLISISTYVGTYIIFTDQHKTELIGILKSKSNLSALKEIGLAKNIFSKGIYQNQ